MSHIDLTLYDVKPTGHTRGFDCHGDGAAKIPTYPRSYLGKAMQSIRIAAGLSFRDAADIFGITPAEASGLERGAKAMDAGDWIKVLERLSEDLDRALCDAETAWCAPMVDVSKPLDPDNYSEPQS